jgi:thiamine-phosphate pyrophosphorylase
MKVEQAAAKLGRAARQRKAASRRFKVLPPLWLLTDPERTADPLVAAADLPRGAAVVYRSFGAVDRWATARALRRLTRARGLQLLIGADWRLAASVGADGVHLPERLMGLAPRLRRHRPNWLISAAAHDRAAITAAGRLGLDAILVSAVFPSRSPSAGRPLGPVRFAALVARANVPVIALGGVNDATAPRLLNSGAAGLAGVSFRRGTADVEQRPREA